MKLQPPARVHVGAGLGRPFVVWAARRCIFAAVVGDFAASAHGVVLKRHQSARELGGVSTELATASDVVAISADSLHSSRFPTQFPTFQQFYDSYTDGRGLSEWNNVLDVYQRHLGALAGRSLKLAEVGVHSGGSIQMWRTVLGPHCHVYGLDANSAALQFQDPMATIAIGSQADPSTWHSFFASTVQAPIDILVDRSGEVKRKSITLMQTFDHLTAGGVVAIEDLHGPRDMQEFFAPAAKYLGAKALQGQLASVHLYPYLLLAQRSGDDLRGRLFFGGRSTVVDNLAALWAAVPHYPGGHVILQNAGWGSLMTPRSLSSIFTMFDALHHADWHDEPTGCQQSPAAKCTITARTGAMQAVITGVHIYPNKLVVEVAGTQVRLQAVRRGSSWLEHDN